MAMDYGSMVGAITQYVAPVLGSIFQNQANAKQADHAMDRSQDSADRAMAFSKEMSNTAYQRQRDDLRNAGLSQTLAYTQGGASTPSGTSASMSPAKMENVGEGLGHAAGQVKEQDIKSKGLAAQIDLNQSTKNIQSAQALNQQAQAEQTSVETAIRKQEAPARVAKAKLDAANAATDYKYKDLDQVNKRINQTLGNVNSARDAVNPTNLAIPKGTTLMKNKTGEVLNERR